MSLDCKLYEALANSIQMWSAFSYHLVIEEALGDTFASHQTVMKIIETNQFKHLCHLCLFISTGTDAEIKKHLAVELKLLKVQMSTFFKNNTNLYMLFCTLPLFAISRHILGLLQVFICHKLLSLKLYLSIHGQGK